MRFDAVILAGGRATRLGGTPKPGIVVGHATLLDHALAASADAERRVVVGPRRDLPLPGTAREGSARGGAAPDVLVTREDPPFGGPVAGIDAGLQALGPAGHPTDLPAWVLLLAVDVPFAAAAVPTLRAAVEQHPGTDGAHLTHDGRAQWLTGIYRRTALAGALSALDPQGAAVRRLVAGLSLVEVTDDAGSSDDADTWEDVNRLSARCTENGDREAMP